jgi:hypothetical protein
VTGAGRAERHTRDVEEPGSILSPYRCFYFHTSHIYIALLLPFAKPEQPILPILPILPKKVVPRGIFARVEDKFPRNTDNHSVSTAARRTAGIAPVRAASAGDPPANIPIPTGLPHRTIGGTLQPRWG